MEIFSALCIGGSLGAVVLVGTLLASTMIQVCRPNELLVYSGRKRALSDGTTVGYRVVHGGWAFLVPLLEKVERIDLRTMPIEIQITNAYAKGGIPLDVHAIANVKVSSAANNVGNAIERFLGQDPAEIRRVAKETLEGHLRGVLARMTPEEVNEDRLKFADELVHEAADDFDRLGLTLDTLKVQSVADQVDYLDSIGRERLANVLSVAEMAESLAKADAEEAQAQAHREGQVAHEQAEGAIRQRTNEYRRVKADLEARARAEEERAEQAGLAAGARAEHRLQEIRARLEHLRLTSDIVLPAESARKASEMRARAQAASISADGQATAEVLRMVTETWMKAGDDARQVFWVQQMEKVIEAISERVSKLEIGAVTLIDDGDGQALPRHIASRPAMVASILQELHHATGINVSGLIAGTDRRLPMEPREGAIEATPAAAPKEVSS
jgi:flotillin